jgi:hypothetical protein
MVLLMFSALVVKGDTAIDAPRCGDISYMYKVHRI